MNTNIKLASIVMGLALLGSPVHAEEDATLYKTLTVSYDSEYLLYGYNFGRDLLHADLSLFRPINDHTSMWAGFWYGYLPNGTYHELDGYVGVDRQLTDTISAGLAYSLFYYIEVPFETDTVAHEFAAHTTVSKGIFSASLWARYDTEGRGTLLHGIASAEHGLHDRVSIRAEAETGYALGYFIEGNRWNHAQFKLKLPVTLCDRTRITPFVAHSIPFTAIDDFASEITYGGVSFSLDL